MVRPFGFLIATFKSFGSAINLLLVYLIIPAYLCTNLDIYFYLFFYDIPMHIDNIRSLLADIKIIYTIFRNRKKSENLESFSLLFRDKYTELFFLLMKINFTLPDNIRNNCVVFLSYNIIYE